MSGSESTARKAEKQVDKRILEDPTRNPGPKSNPNSLVLELLRGDPFERALLRRARPGPSDPERKPINTATGALPAAERRGHFTGESAYCGIE